MTAPSVTSVEELRARRARLAALADELRDELDRASSAATWAQLQNVVVAIDSLDRMISKRRGP
jgi:hypothetical protein